MWIVWLLMACGVPSPLAPVAPTASSARVGTVVLQATEVEVGGTIGFRILGAEPNAPVEIVGGSPGAGNCPPRLAGNCWGVTKTRSLACGVADANGEASFQVAINAKNPGSLLGFQAWVDGATVELSDVVERTLHAAGASPVPLGGNVLIVVFDDLGIDHVGLYGAVDAPATPTLDSLAATGVRFDRAYARPACVPSRAALMTGRSGRRTGVAMNWRQDEVYELGLEQITLPEILDYSPYASYESSLAGKWHLGGLGTPSGFDHPLAQGWDWYAGTFGSLMDNVNASTGYYNWDKVEGGVVVTETTYATTDTANDAIDRIAAMQEPWLLMVSLNAPHDPIQAPPVTLVPTPPVGSNQGLKRMIAAADTELGRILASIPADVLARTHIFALSDNGTTNRQLPAEFQGQGKGTLYDHGVRVPFIVSGPAVGVPGSVSTAFVDLMDVWPTLAELAGVEVEHLPSATDPAADYVVDGISLLPLLADPSAPWPRTVATSELFGPPGPGPYTIDRQMIRNETHKLVVDHIDGVEHFFAYEGEFEGGDLLACGLTADEEAIRAELRAELDEITGAIVYDGGPPAVFDTGWADGYALDPPVALVACDTGP